MTKGHLPPQHSATPLPTGAAGGTLATPDPAQRRFIFSRSPPAKHITMATTATVGGQTLVSRRPSSQGLPPLRISRDGEDVEWLGGWGEGDVEEQGKQLFSNFVNDQVRTESPEAVRDIEVLTPAGYNNPMWAKAGRELRHMADIFAQTAERRRVKQKASEVNTNISYEEFKDLLTELFAAGGITKERIVVLFFFCSDVAIRSLKRGADLCRQFLGWSFSFITDSVCSWVRSHGGWGEVMSSSFNSLPRVLLLAGVIALGFGVFRYIKGP
ncbi:hypothetical protein ACOMHN_000001 [Nucella lapillus]